MMVIVLNSQIKFLDHFFEPQQLHSQQHNTTLKSQLSVFDLGLSCMFHFRIDFCLTEVWSDLRVSSCVSAFNNLYSLFRTWTGVRDNVDSHCKYFIEIQFIQFLKYSAVRALVILELTYNL